ncbi:unnamed protein product [marine sediment metagenome]|uniref:Homing endonuclease LAGLIDADG domain-containing protein n=1 Tax=marine sediment metagenome TaxID=412755 RepID=X1RZN1_9ZZZZ
MTELEKVWLACVIDCEGNMGVYKQPVGKTYRPQIRVDNIDYDFIVRCKSIANKGNIFVEPLRGRRHHCLFRGIGYNLLTISSDGVLRSGLGSRLY